MAPSRSAPAQAQAAPDPAITLSPVSSYTEWDPLEEVVVGRVHGGVFPTWQDSMLATVPDESWPVLQANGGTPYPPDQVFAADEELDAFAAALTAEGVRVVRPDPTDYARPFATPDWSCAGGLYAAMPRDCLIVIGETIVEAPMSWRCRQHETAAYRSLVKSYFDRGARWLTAPTPQLTDELWNPDYRPDALHGSAITEFEPVFDAADFVRFGRDILVQTSHVTNEFGIRWLQRAVGDPFRVRRIEVNDPHAMHIDATIVPLAPGKLLVHPERYLPNELFRDWEILRAPKPMLPAGWPMYLCSPWVSMNLLSLDEHTVFVERHEEPLIDALTGWGFRCIPLDFRHVYTLGGSFHCVTLDVRRRGALATYLD